MLDWPVWPFQLAILGICVGCGTLSSVFRMAGSEATTAGIPGMTALLLVGIVVALLILRQPLLVILMSVAAYIHIVWGQPNSWITLLRTCGSVSTRK